MIRAVILSLGILTPCIATQASADPCNAIPERGPMPPYLQPGATFRGPVVYVGDGDSLCVAVGRGSDHWVEVRLADFYAPELKGPAGGNAKAALSSITKGKVVDCTAHHRSYDRVVAQCLISGVSLGDRLRDAGIIEGGNGR